MSTEKLHDYIVVGSGCTGVQAAQTLVEKGFSVLMLDVGNEDQSQVEFPNSTFSQIRNEDKNQSTNFLGKKYEGIPWGEIKPGYHLTPGRKYVAKDIEKFIPYKSDNTQLFESLAKGGLGSAWGTGSYIFSATELENCGLNKSEMNEAYSVIFSRIGITKGNPSNNFQEEEAIITDISINKIKEEYSKKSTKLNKKGITISQTPLAVITKDRGNRKGYKFRDMDFWDDNDLSAYRPWITLNELKIKEHFTYINNALVLKYIELENYIEVQFIDVLKKKKKKYLCKKLILAASVFGTSRIVLRSNNGYGVKLKYLCNPYYYIPCVNFRMLGKANSDKRTSFSQLSIYIDAFKETFVGSVFTYRSLLLFKLIKESPLNFKVSRMLFRFLQSSFMIVGFHVSKKFSDTDFISLEKDESTITKDHLKVFSNDSLKELDNEKIAVNKLKSVLKSLGCFPLKSIKSPKGSSIHYAGTLPFSKNGEKFTTDMNGKLSGTKNIYIVDASTFTYLPAKGVTLTAMANAHRVALKSMKE